jgi:hypothetical protein
VEATQKSRTITNSIALVRAIRDQDWPTRRNRTGFDFSGSYGLVSQPNTPTVKTSIYHADAERDEYFSPAIFGFGQAQFDHNYSQGLDLQQRVQESNEGLDLKGGISFSRQQFSGSTTAKNLAASVFDEKYLRKFFHGITFAQEFSVSPAWTQTKALSAFGSASLALPVYKHFSFTVGAIDNFLNDPPPGFKKNSVQFTTASPTCCRSGQPTAQRTVAITVDDLTHARGTLIFNDRATEESVATAVNRKLLAAFRARSSHEEYGRAAQVLSLSRESHWRYKSQARRRDAVTYPARVYGSHVHHR